MKIYLVTSEWQVAGIHEWDNSAFEKREDAERFVEGDKNDVLLDIENGEYSNSMEDYTITKDSITSFDNEEWFQWSIEELEVL